MIGRYVADLEKAGHKAHWPARGDTNQDDPVGLRICNDNLSAIKYADEIHIWWNKKSSGSLFDFGMAFALGKRIVLINPDLVWKIIEEENRKGVIKSFNKVVFKLAKRIRQ